MRQTWTVGVALLACVVGRDPFQGAVGLAWHDAQKIGLEGRAWPDAEMKRPFARLPGRAQGKVPAAVWFLAQHSAGLMARFETDAPAIHVRYTLMSESLALPHMPATGVSGVDLYGRDEKGAWRWIGVTKPAKKEVEAALATGLPAVKREYAIYLPLYNGVERLEVGVPEKASFRGMAPRPGKPIVFYGTSITHGACASRPGMCHPAILGRRLDRPVVNLGFSGSGRMEPSVGEFLAEIDAAVFVLDCLPNMDPDMVRERVVPMVRQLRKARPEASIMLVEDRPFTNTWAFPGAQKFHRENHAALKAAWGQLRGESTPRLFYLEGDSLLGGDAEGSTDGSHPSDLGFVRQADAFEPVLRQALEASGARGLPGGTDDWRGYVRRIFECDGRRCFAVEPRQPAPGRPWIWRAEFFDAFPAFDLAMLEKGWWLVYMDVQNLYGGPEAMKHFDALYDFLTKEHGFSKRPVLEGLSRGGLFVFNWAARRPDSVGVVYGDGAVCDFKSWPGGKGKGPGSRGDWERLRKVYGFKDEAEALAYGLNPVDNLDPLAKAKVPILLVTGDADEVVPHGENTAVVQERYERLGGTVRVFVKPGGKHHPHGLPDPAPLVDFVLRHGPGK